VRRYKKDSAVTIRVELTANHRGYFEFRLCPNNAPRHAGTQACLDKYVLRRAKFAGVTDEQNHETRYYPAAGNKVGNKIILYLHVVTWSVIHCISCVQKRYTLCFRYIFIILLWNICKYYLNICIYLITTYVNFSSHTYYRGLGLWQLNCWDNRFKSCWGQTCLSLVFVVCCVGSSLCDGLTTCTGVYVI
jgi:hypothetical protein